MLKVVFVPMAVGVSAVIVTVPIVVTVFMFQTGRRVVVRAAPAVFPSGRAERGRHGRTAVIDARRGMLMVVFIPMAVHVSASIVTVRIVVTVFMFRTVRHVVVRTAPAVFPSRHAERGRHGHRTVIGAGLRMTMFAPMIVRASIVIVIACLVVLVFLSVCSVMLPVRATLAVFQISSSHGGAADVGMFAVDFGLIFRHSGPLPWFAPSKHPEVASRSRGIGSMDENR